jgi:hypothetical protein
MAAALAYAHHGLQQPPSSGHDVKDQVWAGQLAAAVPANPGPAAALSSASLVVPKAQLALPADPPKPKFHVRAVCDSADTDCIPSASIPAPPPRKFAVAEPKIAISGAWDVSPPRPPGLIPPPAKQGPSAHAGAAEAQKAQNNPSILARAGRPFAAIGHTVAGWIKWL